LIARAYRLSLVGVKRPFGRSTGGVGSIRPERGLVATIRSADAMGLRRDAGRGQPAAELPVVPSVLTSGSSSRIDVLNMHA
jgi:hypothetical protein